MLDFPEADPEMRIWVQVVRLGSDTRNTWKGNVEVGQGGKLDGKTLFCGQIVTGELKPSFAGEL